MLGHLVISEVLNASYQLYLKLRTVPQLLVYDTTSSGEHLISVQASFNTLSLVQNDSCDFFFH